MFEKTAGSAIAEYDPIISALTAVEKYRGLVCDVSTPQGLAEAKSAHKEVAAVRIALEKTRKKVKEDVVARGKLIDGEANKYFAQIAAIEEPIKSQIEAEERREQEAREAAIKAEQDRLAREEAERKAAEEAKLAAERAAIDKERAELEAQQRAAREKIEAEERAARARIEEEARKERLAQQAREEVARVKAREEEERLRAEREKLEAERRAKDEADRKEREAAEAQERAARLALEESMRKEREAKEAEQRERQRLVLEKSDARTSLEIWRNRYGHLPEYAGVVRAMDECLELA